MRFVLADENTDVRFALGIRLAQESDVSVVGEAANARELISQIETTRPDIIFLDWELPGMAIIDLMDAIRDVMDLAVVILSTHNRAEQSALAIGADAFVCKTSPPEVLIKTVNTVVQGLNYSEAR
jgi:DNA-binding NarL/FixJ family response regulator